MKIVKWTSKCRKSKNEDEVYVRLFAETDDARMVLAMCDKNGKAIWDGNLLMFDDDVRGIIFCRGVSSSYPYKTDLHGCALHALSKDMHELSSGLGKILSSLRPR